MHGCYVRMLPAIRSFLLAEVHVHTCMSSEQALLIVLVLFLCRFCVRTLPLEKFRRKLPRNMNIIHDPRVSRYSTVSLSGLCDCVMRYAGSQSE